MKIHKRDQRLYINAGICFPACHAGAKLLDLDRGRLTSTTDNKAVTCKQCLKIMEAKQ